jgi:hypothetical protein
MWSEPGVGVNPTAKPRILHPAFERWEQHLDKQRLFRVHGKISTMAQQRETGVFRDFWWIAPAFQVVERYDEERFSPLDPRRNKNGQARPSPAVSLPQPGRGNRPLPEQSLTDRPDHALIFIKSY